MNLDLTKISAKTEPANETPLLGVSANFFTAPTRKPMKTERMTITVRELYNLKEKLNFQPTYQRGGEVWSMPKKKDLIYSVLRGYDLPKLYFHDNDGKFDVVDGQQRSLALIGFLDNLYRCSDRIKSYAHKYYCDLPDAVRHTIDRYPLDVVFIRECTLADIREMFLLLQNGVALCGPEKRHAIGGWFGEQITALASHPFFSEILALSNRRMVYESIAARCILWEYNGDIMRDKASELKPLYETFGVRDEEMEKTFARARHCFDMMYKLFQNQEGIRLQGTMTSLIYWMFSRLPERQQEFQTHLVDFVLDFEFKRKNALKRRAPADQNLIGFTRLMGLMDHVKETYRVFFERYNEYVVSIEEAIGE